MKLFGDSITSQCQIWSCSADLALGAIWPRTPWTSLSTARLVRAIRVSPIAGLGRTLRQNGPSK